MSISEKIKAAREQLGLTDVKAAEKVGLSIYEYGDLESYDNEAETVLDLGKLKKLCETLEIDLFELFSLDRPESHYLTYDLERRNDIVSERRNALGLSQDELGDKVSFYGHVIQEMEDDSDFLESWCLEDVIALAKSLNVPSWVLIGKV